MRTAQRVSTRALLIPLPRGPSGDDFHCTLDHPLHLRQSRVDHHCHLGTRLCGLHPVIPEAFAPFGHRVLDPPANKRLDSDGFMFYPVRRVGAIMLRAPLTIIAIHTPDGDRRAHHVLGHVAGYTLILGRAVAFLHGGHQAVGILPETRIDPLPDRLGLQRLAHHRQQVPLPLPTQERLRPVLEMLPTCSWRRIAPTGGQPMQVRGGLTMTPMRVEHHDGAPSECRAPDRAIERIQAVGPTADERAQPHRCMLVAGRAEHRQHRQDDGAIAHPIVAHGAHLTAPVIYRNLRAAQAQGRLAAHRHPMRTLPTVQAALFDIPHRGRIATRQPLGNHVIIGGRLVARMGLLKPLPGLGKELLKDTPVRGGGCKHPPPPSEGGWDCDGAVVVPRLLRTVHSSSPMAIPAYRSNTKNANS
jgi:hypothetical protein